VEERRPTRGGTCCCITEVRAVFGWLLESTETLPLGLPWLMRALFSLEPPSPREDTGGVASADGGSPPPPFLPGAPPGGSLPMVCRLLERGIACGLAPCGPAPPTWGGGVDLVGEPSATQPNSPGLTWSEAAQAPLALGIGFFSWLGGLRERTAGTIWRRALGGFAASEWPVWPIRGLTFGDPVALDDPILVRALANAPAAEGGPPKRESLGEASALFLGPRSVSEVLDELCCIWLWLLPGDCERPGEVAWPRGACKGCRLDVLAARPCAKPDAAVPEGTREVRSVRLPRADIEVFSALSRAVPRPRVLAAAPLALVRGELRKPTRAARSVEGDCDLRLPTEEVDCTDEDRRTPEYCRHAAGLQSPAAPPVPPSVSLPNSSISLSCCRSCSLVAVTWLLISENW